MAEQPQLAIIEDGQECHLVGARADGALSVTFSGANHDIVPAGVVLIQPPSAAYFEFIDRLTGARRSLRCRIIGRTQSGRERAEIFYFAWQDKSGDVWLNLAMTLIEQGFGHPNMNDEAP